MLWYQQSPLLHGELVISDMLMFQECPPPNGNVGYQQKMTRHDICWNANDAGIDTHAAHQTDMVNAKKSMVHHALISGMSTSAGHQQQTSRDAVSAHVSHGVFQGEACGMCIISLTCMCDIVINVNHANEMAF